MFKPTMAAVIGLVCVAAAAAEMGVFGNAGGDEGAAARATLEGQGPRSATSAGDDRLFAQVPGSNAVYGWRYPYAFSWEPTLNGYRETPAPPIHPGTER